jgi:hypothetical protein
VWDKDDENTAVGNTAEETAEGERGEGQKRRRRKQHFSPRTERFSHS